MRVPSIVIWLFLVIALFVVPFPALAAGDKKTTFSQAELDQMMAPVALYPDSLLSQILMASTYPDQVSEAAAWSKKNPKEQGDAAVKAVQDKAWDPSVASLVAFPQVLAMMGNKPDWVKKMGDAFLAEPKNVMDTVQKLRKKAKNAGNLKSTEQEKVATEGQTIIIQPASPQVVYVPVYNPTVVYGTWWWPAYPPYYFPPPPGYSFAAGMAAGIGFGVGIAVTNSLWGGFNWHSYNVNINVNHYNNINVNHRLNVNKNTVSWKHNAVNRQGVPYADKASAKKYGQKLGGADQRQDFRGRDAQRENALAALQSKGINPAAERKELSGSGGAQVRDQVNKIDREQKFGADRGFSGRDSDGMRGRGGKFDGSRGKSRDFSSSSFDNAFTGLGDKGGMTGLSTERGRFSDRSTGGGRSFGGGGRFRR